MVNQWAEVTIKIFNIYAELLSEQSGSVNGGETIRWKHNLKDLANNSCYAILYADNRYEKVHSNKISFQIDHKGPHIEYFYITPSVVSKKEQSSVQCRFSIAESGEVRINIYNVAGERVILLTGPAVEGGKDESWELNISHLASLNMYYATLSARDDGFSYSTSKTRFYVKP